MCKSMKIKHFFLLRWWWCLDHLHTVDTVTHTHANTNVNHNFLCFRFKLQMYCSIFFIFIYLFKITRTKTVRHSHLSTQLFITDGNIRNITFLLTYFNTHYTRRVYFSFIRTNTKKKSAGFFIFTELAYAFSFTSFALYIFLILPSSNNNNNTDETRHINRWIYIMKILLFIIMETVQMVCCCCHSKEYSKWNHIAYLQLYMLL